MAVYACSDVHGHLGLFKEALSRLSPNDEVYLVGDAIDRGPDSMGVLLAIEEDPRAHLVLGNHELMALSAIEELKKTGIPGENYDVWTMPCNGGKRNHEAFEALSKEERSTVVEVMKGSLIQKVVETGGLSVCLCHSFFWEDWGTDEGTLKDVSYDPMYKKGTAEYERVFDSVWASPYRPDSFCPPQWYAAHSGVVFVIGHVPIVKLGRALPVLDGNVIDIDGGLAYAGIDPDIDKVIGLHLLNIDEFAKEVASGKTSGFSSIETIGL